MGLSGFTRTVHADLPPEPGERVVFAEDPQGVDAAGIEEPQVRIGTPVEPDPVDRHGMEPGHVHVESLGRGCVGDDGEAVPDLEMTGNDPGGEIDVIGLEPAFEFEAVGDRVPEDRVQRMALGMAAPECGAFATAGAHRHDRASFPAPVVEFARLDPDGRDGFDQGPERKPAFPRGIRKEVDAETLGKVGEFKIEAALEGVTRTWRGGMDRLEIAHGKPKSRIGIESEIESVDEEGGEPGEGFAKAAAGASSLNVDGAEIGKRNEAVAKAAEPE